MNPYIRFFGSVALALAILYFGVMFFMYLKTERTPPQDYPDFTPTELPVIPAWTPNPGERGKG